MPDTLRTAATSEMVHPRTPSPQKTAADDSRELMLDVLRQFRVVIRSIKMHYQAVEKRAGVSGAQLWAIERIGTNPGITVGDLAAELAIHSSTASNLLDRLQELKFIERRRESSDQRQVQLYLTAKGQGILAKAPGPLRGVLQQALSEMRPASLAGLHQRLDELLAVMQVRDERAGSRPLSDL